MREAQNFHSLKIWALRSQFWEAIPVLETVSTWEAIQPGKPPVYQVSFFYFLFIYTFFFYIIIFLINRLVYIFNIFFYLISHLIHSFIILYSL